MLISFEDLPSDARIWIYQSDKPLDAVLRQTVTTKLSQFAGQWEAHGQPLRASVRIAYDRFVIIGVDERFNPVTGCSTDASVNFVRALGKDLEIDFFNRMALPLMIEDRIEIIGLDRFKKKDLPKEVSESSLTFDNLINEKGQLEDGWVKPVGETWLAKYLG